MRRLLIGVSRKIEYSIRIDFFSHLQRLDSSFFESNRTGSVMALITNDLDAVRNFLGPGLLNLFNTIFTFISTLIIMFLISIRLTLFSLIAIPVLPLIVSRLSAMLYNRFKLSQEQYALLSARTQESIAGIKVVKSFTQEKNEIDTFSALNKDYINKNLALAQVRSIFWPLMILIGGIGSLVVLWVGGIQVIERQLTLGQFVQFSAYIIAITWPLISLGWVINLIQRGEVSMARLNKIFKMQPQIKEPASPAKLTELKGNIVFKNVYFKYPKMASYESYFDPEDAKNNKLQVNYDKNSPGIKNYKNYNDNTNDTVESKSISTSNTKISDNSNTGSNCRNNTIKNITQNKAYTKDSSAGNQWILKNINFEISPGMQFGIVGFTGSGKSTIVNLIPRLYEPQNGSIFIDGKDINKISLSVLRSNIAYITQDPFIFSKTIKENIIFGREANLLKLSENHLNNKILEASKISHLHEDVESFPNGYQTLVGERGITLSGGQRQRLAIARALMAEPKILILDDSFSNIDTNTEELILKDLKAKTENLTKIIISHRISTIKDSDLIIVIDEGEIIETGNHKELLKKCGIYQRLYYRQQLSEELKEEI